ncbi:hypothetical protein C8J57DRAFT_1475664 [Mycena rebaudengoi]|nr:hypothetical protein C8J57DRAFT_1475664 [Mycena rebaudengoi]
MDLSFRALLDSGIQSRGEAIGCFMSGNQQLRMTTINTNGSLAGAPFNLSNRISYVLNLTGPSITLDTACSASLMALHLATGAIERGDCVAALIGAAQVNRDDWEWNSYTQAGVLSPDGRSKPFDESANGFGRGEGAVVIVVKSLTSATVADHDHIYAVIAGSAINTTGSRMPLNIPNALTQQLCIRKAYSRAGLDPQDADFVELHATGTSVGDPVETTAAGEIFGGPRGALIGAVKGNIGHMEVAAFLASLVKACLIFEHSVIPPTVNVSSLTPKVGWSELNLSVPVDPTPLGCRSSSGRPIISISAFGVGGATGHVVLQAPPRPKPAIEPASGPILPILCLIGGLSSAAVEQISQAVLQDGSDALHAYAVTLSRRARQLPWRTYFILPRLQSARIPPAVLTPSPSPLVAFVFCGQGPQNLGMGRDLFATYPVFRRTILELDDVYRSVCGISLIQSTGLFAGTPSNSLEDSAWPIKTTLSALAMIQIALVDLLKSVGVIPQLLFGHSAGETAALYASGAGSKEMALEIAIARGATMGLVQGSGTEFGLAMVSCSAERAAELLLRVQIDSGVAELACYNAPDAVVVSGNAAILDDLVALSKSEGLFAQRICAAVPAHSSLMDPIQYEYMRRMHAIFERYPGSHVPAIPVLSTCRTNKFVADFTPEYFWDNCRNPVLFSKAVNDALMSSPVFFEIAPHPVFSSSILAHGVSDLNVLCPMRRASRKASLSVSISPRSEPEIFLDTLGSLSLLGLNSIDLTNLYGVQAVSSELIDYPLVAREIPPPLPAKSFQRSASTAGPLSGSILKMNMSTHPDLAEHVLGGEPVMPATGFIELVLETGANVLSDVEFASILSLGSSSPVEVTLQRLRTNWFITSGTTEHEHVRGILDKAPPTESPPSRNYSAVWARLPSLNVTGLYKSLEPELRFGPRFQRVVRCAGHAGEILAEIRGQTEEELSDGYALHPIALDACIHVVLHPATMKRFSQDAAVYIPWKLERFTLHNRSPSTGNWFSHIRLREWTPDTRVYDVLVTHSSGAPICAFKNFTLKKLDFSTPTQARRGFGMILQPVICGAIPTLDKTFPQRADKPEVQLLLSVLDSLAVDMMSASITNVEVAVHDVSRSRYLESARRAIAGDPKINVDAATLQRLKASWPVYFEITHRISTIHKSVYHSPKSAVDVLYSDDLMAQFYSKQNQQTDVCIHAGRAFGTILGSLRLSGKKMIKVLEVGAGTGLLTHPLVDALSEHPDMLVQYTVTDLSFSLVAELAQTVAREFVIPRAYDIAKDPQSQGFALETYDVIVASHVLHAAPNIEKCLSSLRDLLLPGGNLLIVELDGTDWQQKPGSIWFDCIFGSFPEWFGFEDGREHCTMTPSAWGSILRSSGFISVHTCTEMDGRQEFFFVAQKSPVHISTVGTPAIASGLTFRFQAGQEMALQTWIQEIETQTPTAIYVLALRGIDGDTAMGLCSTLRNEMPGWTIRLAIFDSASGFDDPVLALSQFFWLFESGEDSIYVDEGGVPHVSRVNFLPDCHGETSPVHESTIDGSGVVDVQTQSAILHRRSASPPFRSDRTYILLGGIGGLGVDLAVWMYEHGARYIVLTSRRGLNSLHPATDSWSLAKIRYLQTQSDLDLRLLACDAAKEKQMAEALSTLAAPIAGCFLMTLALSDAIFANQTESAFARVRESKLGVLHTFSTLVNIDSIDFLVGFSSVNGLIGLAGQSNYASACMAFNGALAKYSNAFSLIVPGISDAGYLDRRDDYTRKELGTMSAAALWDCLHTGLRHLGQFKQFIPTLNWDALNSQSPLPSSCRYMVSGRKPTTSPGSDPARAPLAEGADMLDKMLNLLEVTANDFDANQPLTAYGMDSITAAKMSAVLRPFASFSQTRLLSGVTWAVIKGEIDGAAAAGL